MWIDFKKVKMIKIYFTKCKKCKEFRKPKWWYICDKTLLLSNENIFKEKESIEIIKTLFLINNM